MSRVTAELTRKRMEAAREDTAGQVLAWEAVAKEIGAAAGKGYGLALFASPTGVSIRGTATAAAMVEKLTIAGFRCAWRERRDPGDVQAFDLAVSWEAAPIGGG